jgi:starch phosphorylase
VNDFSVLPIRPFHDAAGVSYHVRVEMAEGRVVVLRPWRAQVGRITLVLLDSNLPENPEDLRDVTGELYGGGNDMRIMQEMALGIGGVRALAALGYRPGAYHMNEGHCAFLGLERARALMRERALSAREALEIVASSGVFTTHTPVPAGIDQFATDEVDATWRGCVRSWECRARSSSTWDVSSRAGSPSRSTWRSSPSGRPGSSTA